MRGKNTTSTNHMNSKIRLLPALAALLVFPLTARAVPVSTAFNYQGRLDHNGAVANGLFDLKFEIYTEWTGGTPAVPAIEVQGLAVSGGLISADLDFGGATVFDGRAYYLQTYARQQGSPTYVLVPGGRTAIRPAPYSIHALSAASVKDGSVTSASLASGAVTSAKLAAGAVTTANLATGAVGLAQLNAGAPPQINSLLAYNGTGLAWQSPQSIGQWGTTNSNDGIFFLGKVGIGTNSPASKLTVFSSGYGMEHTDGSVRMGTYIDSRGGFIGSNSAHPMHFYSNNSAAVMTIGTSGSVGIGTTTPGAKLDIASQVGQDAVRITGYQPYVTLNDSNASNAGARIQNLGGEIYMYPVSYVSGASTQTYVKINNAGNVSMTSCTIRGGADLAEPFAMSHDGVEPGTVVVIDAAHPGKLKRSTCAYDKKVAGIVSGANGIKPGISMIQEDMLEAGENVALSGRVFVKADTSAGSIEPGDLLTTSSAAGRAMKAADHGQAQGAIIGKAMTGLTDGEGMVLVLVTLQ